MYLRHFYFKALETYCTRGMFTVWRSKSGVRICSFEKEDEDEPEQSMLGLQSYWDATYAEELTNFHEHGDAGEIWWVVIMEGYPNFFSYIVVIIYTNK